MTDKPFVTPDQYATAITTSWGGSDEGIARSWATTNLTYEIGTFAGEVEDGSSDAAGYTPMTVNQANFVQAALDEWSQIANVTFTPFAGDTSEDHSQPPDITIAYSTADGTTHTHPTLSSDHETIKHQAVWLKTATSPDFTDANISYINYGFVSMLHELGHALGPSHPGPYDGAATFDDDAVIEQDNRQYSIMSYFGYEQKTVEADGTIHIGWAQDGTPNGSLDPAATVIYPSTPMVMDMLAIQEKYGANMSTRAGDTTYGFHSNAGEDYYDFSKFPEVVFTIWDGGGNDTLDASFTGGFTQSIDLNAGDYSSVGGLVNNIGIAYGVTIENAVGGDGKDRIVGNDSNNQLRGMDGDDVLLGEGGDDTLDGGAGNDHLDGGGSDNLHPDTLTGGTGDDTFIYQTGYQTTVITDFSQDVDGNSDTLDLQDEKAVHSFADLLADATRQGPNTVFDFGGTDLLVLQNFQLSTLTPDQIEFSEPTQGAPGEFLLAANPYYPNFDYSYFTKTAALSNGNFVGITEDANTYFSQEIEAQAYDARGVVIPNQGFTVNTTRLGSDNGSVLDPNFQVVQIANGNFVAVWQTIVGDEQPVNGDGPLIEIRYRVFNADGTPQGPNAVANATPAVPQHNVTGPNGTSLTGLGLVTATPSPDGSGFVVYWNSDTNTADNTPAELFSRTFDANGTPAGGDQDLGANHALRTTSDPVDFQTPTDGDVRVWQAAVNGTEHAYAEIVGKTDPVQLDGANGYVPDNSDNLTPDITVSELADGQLVFTWGAGGVFQSSFFTETIFVGSESVIYDSELQGFTKAGTSGADFLKGSIYNDQLYGLTGSNYNDHLVGDQGVNVIKGGYGNDVIIGGGGADQLYGGAGSDTITLTGDGGSAFGEAGADVITLTGNNAFAYGGDDHDFIAATGDGNTLSGDAGDDEVDLNSGSNNLLMGGDGNDTIFVGGAGSGNTVEGGAGNDTITVEGSNTGTHVEGGAGKDVLNAEFNTGGVYLSGGDDADILTGGSGDDFLEGDGGKDIIFGGAGIDTAVFSGNFADYKVTFVPGPQGGFQVEDMRPGSPDGEDAVFNDVEKLQFADGTYDAGYFETTSKGGDGYITGATVFADTNGNGVLDSGEVSTTTDAGGGFTMPNGASGPLVLFGGTDIGTGLAFSGKFLAPAGYTEINALTTIVELLAKDNVLSPAQTVVANLNLDPATNLANTDPISDFLGPDGQPETVNIQIANTVDLIASAIEGAHPGQFANAYADAFHALASAIGGGSFDLTDSSTITNVIDATLSAGPFTLDPGVASGVAEIIAAVNVRVSPYDLAAAEAAAKVAQGDAATAVKLAGADPSTITGAVTSFTDTALDDAISQQAARGGNIVGPYINTIPIPHFDFYTTTDNGQLTVDAAHGVLANDVDYDGDALKASLNFGPQFGAVTLNPDGSFTYSPNANFGGTDFFSYFASDGTTQRSQSVDIDVTGPVVTNITASPASGALHDGDTITFTVTMSSAVIVDQTRAPLFLTTNDGNILYQSGSGTDTLVFTSPLEDDDNGAPLSVTYDDNGADGDAVVTDALTGVLADLSGARVTFSDITVACYCRGTLIRTERDEMAVQDLSVGDLVVTASGSSRPIKWIGTRSYGGRFIAGCRNMLPICFKTGSLGEGLPRRDLWISPHHAMYLDGVLIEAKDLVNDISIVQAKDVDQVDYFHIELDSHDVILAEGAWSETFVDDDSRGMFHNACEFAALYPDEVLRPARYCAPRVEDGFEIEAVRQRLARLAGAQGGTSRIGTLRGFIDQAGAGCISGWAQNEEHPEAPVCLDIFVRGQLVGQALADGYRHDLETARFGSGRHGFAFVPLPDCHFQPEDVVVKRSLDGATLAMTACARRAMMRAAA